MMSFGLKQQVRTMHALLRQPVVSSMRSSQHLGRIASVQTNLMFCSSFNQRLFSAKVGGDDGRPDEKASLDLTDQEEFSTSATPFDDEYFLKPDKMEAKEEEAILALDEFE
jgi:hypothetical protein